jgi:hypothetical protein
VLKTCGAAPRGAPDATVASASPDASRLDAAVIIATADAAPAPLDATAIATTPRDAAPKRHPPRVDAGARVRVDAAAPPPTRPDAAPAATGHGFITITADPFALIRIDGKDWGTTPIYKRKISAGPHTVDLVSPDSGEVRLHREIEVIAGVLTKISI